MLFFNWRGLDANQKPCQGSCIASDAEHAQRQLQQQSIEVQSMTPQPRWQQWLRRAQIKQKDTYWLLQKISMMLSAGISLAATLETLATQKSSLQAWVGLILAHIQHGTPIKQAFASTDLFDALTLNLIEVGQETGALDTCFQRLHQNQTQNLNLKRQIQSALFYPAVLALVTGCVAYFLLTEILPGICEMYAEQPDQLPWITQQLLAGIAYFEQGSNYLSGLLLFVVALLQKSVRHQLRLWSFGVLSRLPWTSTLTELHLMQRFFRIFSICLQCHLPITQSLRMLKSSHFLPHYQQTMTDIEQNLLQGNPLHQIMTQAPLFNNQPLAINLIKVGEQTGQLTSACTKLAELYEAELNQQLQTLSKTIEPLMLLIMTAVIGALVFSIYLPIFEISSLVQS